jgi:hypothetical protein
MLCVLLGVYHTLMWDRILQYCGGGGVGGLLCLFLLSLLRGRLRWGGGKAPRVFDELGENRLATILRKGLEE